MGYAAQPFAVDLNQVRQVLGSKDSVLVEKIKASKCYSTYARQVNKYGFDEVLNDLIINYDRPEHRTKKSGFLGLFKTEKPPVLDPEIAHEYGYALLVICNTLGTHLSPDADVFYAGGFWKEANQLFKERGITINLDRMWQAEKLFDIPDIADFPVISHYSKDEINYLLTELNKIEIDDNKADPESDEFEELQELLKTFRDGLQTCKNKNVEWVSFLH